VKSGDTPTRHGAEPSQSGICGNAFTISNHALDRDVGRAAKKPEIPPIVAERNVTGSTRARRTGYARAVDSG